MHFHKIPGKETAPVEPRSRVSIPFFPSVNQFLPPRWKRVWETGVGIFFHVYTEKGWTATKREEKIKKIKKKEREQKFISLLNSNVKQPRVVCSYERKKRKKKGEREKKKRRFCRETRTKRRKYRFPSRFVWKLCFLPRKTRTSVSLLSSLEKRAFTLARSPREEATIPSFHFETR